MVSEKAISIRFGGGGDEIGGLYLGDLVRYSSCLPLRLDPSRSTFRTPEEACCEFRQRESRYLPENSVYLRRRLGLYNRSIGSGCSVWLGWLAENWMCAAKTFSNIAPGETLFRLSSGTSVPTLPPPGSVPDV
jgi:hypothetical protein